MYLIFFNFSESDPALCAWQIAIASASAVSSGFGTDSRFKYIKRPDWDAVEFKTKDTLIYFLNPLASEVYLNKKR